MTSKSFALLSLTIILITDVVSLNATELQPPETWHRIEPAVSGICNDIAHRLNEYRSQNIFLKLDSEEVQLKGLKYPANRREGCKVSLEGPLLEDHPDMNAYFKDNGWEEIPEYSIDNSWGGTEGYYKASIQTFCVDTEQGEGDAMVDPPSKSFLTRIICIHAIRQELAFKTPESLKRPPNQRAQPTRSIGE